MVGRRPVTVCEIRRGLDSSVCPGGSDIGGRNPSLYHVAVAWRRRLFKAVFLSNPWREHHADWAWMDEAVVSVVTI